MDFCFVCSIMSFICMAYCTMHSAQCATWHTHHVCPPSHFHHILRLRICFHFYKYKIWEQCFVNALDAHTHTFALRQNIERNKSDRAPALNMFHCCIAWNHCAQPEAAKYIRTLFRSFREVHLLHLLSTHIYSYAVHSLAKPINCKTVELNLVMHSKRVILRFVYAWYKLRHFIFGNRDHLHPFVCV